MLYIWKVERTDSVWYDQYDAIVVVARTEDEARQIHPYGDGWKVDDSDRYGSWSVKPETLKVTKLGTATRGSDIKAGAVVLASFNAG